MATQRRRVKDLDHNATDWGTVALIAVLGLCSLAVVVLLFDILGGTVSAGSVAYL